MWTSWRPATAPIRHARQQVQSKAIDGFLSVETPRGDAEGHLYSTVLRRFHHQRPSERRLITAWWTSG